MHEILSYQFNAFSHTESGVTLKLMSWSKIYSQFFSPYASSDYFFIRLKTSFPK